MGIPMSGIGLKKHPTMDKTKPVLDTDLFPVDCGFGRDL